MANTTLILSAGNFGGWQIDGNVARSPENRDITLPAEIDTTLVGDALTDVWTFADPDGGPRWAYRQTDGVFVGMM